MSDNKKQRIIEYGTNDIRWCEEHRRYEQFASFTDAHGVTTEYVSHRTVPINPVTGLPWAQQKSC